MNKKDLILLCYLRQNARMQLTDMSRATGIPVSTLYERLMKQKYIRKFSAIPDFSLLGFGTRAFVLITVHKNDKESLRTHLMNHPNVNSLYRINNGFDFIFEGIWQNVGCVEDFFDLLEKQFHVRQRIVHYVISDLKQETFLSNPEFADWAMGRE